MAPSNSVLTEALLEIALSTAIIYLVINYFFPNYSVVIKVLFSFLMVYILSYLLQLRAGNFEAFLKKRLDKK